MNNKFIEKFGDKIQILWKILFLTFSLFLLYESFKNSHSTHINHKFSELMGLAINIIIFLMYITFSYLWSLSFKIKLFSKLINKIYGYASGIILFGMPIYMCIEVAFKQSLTLDIVGVLSLITMIIIVLAIVSIIALPILFMFWYYDKTENAYSMTKVPYLKTLAIFLIFSIQFGLVFNNIKHLLTSHKLFTIQESISFSLYLYELIFLTGFSLGKMLLAKKFWKLTFIPFIICLIWDIQHSKSFVEIINTPWSLKIALIVLLVLISSILYLYAFTDTIEEKTSKIIN